MAHTIEAYTDRTVARGTRARDRAREDRRTRIALRGYTYRIADAIDPDEALDY